MPDLVPGIDSSPNRGFSVFDSELQLIPTIAVRLVAFFTYFCFVLRQGKQNMSKQNILIHVAQQQSEIMDR
jgi:hypothetical protein